MKTKTKKFWALKKLDISYNTASLYYINDKLKDIMPEEEKEFIHQEHS